MEALVLIADIVQSRRIANRAAFQKGLGATLSAINRRSGADLVSPYTITVGDEFQAVYRKPRGLFSDVMRIVRGSFPSRIRFALSYGPITTALNRRAALGMDGPVFASARSVLEGLKSEARTIVRLELPRRSEADLMNICLTLWANELERWNRNAVSAFALLLEGRKGPEIARETGVHFTTAYRHIREKHMEDYRRMLALVSARLAGEMKGAPG